MAIQQPQSTDILSSPDHSLSHRVFANDDSAPVQSVVVDSTGKVGIGTITPSGHLDINTETAETTNVIINGEANQDKFLKIRHYDASEAPGINQNALFIGSVTGGKGTLGHFNGSSAQVDVLTWDESGNVGIGTATPSGAASGGTTLQVGTQMVLQQILAGQGGLMHNAYYDGTWKYVTSDSASAIRFDQAAGNIQFHSVAAGTAEDTITDWDSTGIKMTIQPSGNVGIGTTGPDNTLHVSSDLANGQLRLSATAEAHYWDIGREGQTTGRLVFINAAGGAATEKLSILTTGEVGIGVTDPDELLEVAGNVKQQTQRSRNVWFDAGTSAHTSDLFAIDQDGVFLVEITVGHHGGTIASGYGYKRYIVWTSSVSSGESQITELDSVIGGTAAISLGVSGANIRATIDDGANNTIGMIKVEALNGSILDFA